HLLRLLSFKLKLCCKRIIETKCFERTLEFERRERDDLTTDLNIKEDIEEAVASIQSNLKL
ncbi:MAG: hypothetical protein COA73_17305, partial [Candidatus Hydrogenedentota bacterium]